MSDILPLSWFQRETSEVAYDLIGCVLCKRQPDGQVIRCTISETEAYLGVRDKACHSYNDKRTARTEVMYRHGGSIYVYLIYGMYEMLNIITQTEGVPEGVMIRSAFLNSASTKKEYSVHDKFHRTLILSGFCLLKIAKISLNSSFFPKPIKR